MDLIPIPYFGMIMALLVAPSITFAFIYFLRKSKHDVEKLKYQKEIMELEVKKEELHLKNILEENKKYDKLLEENIMDASKAQ
jgi:uncharacterized membrane protein (DUF106 family)